MSEPSIADKLRASITGRASGRALWLALGCALAAVVLMSGLSLEEPLRCRFGREFPVVRSRGKLIDALALTARPDRAIAFWSDVDGLYARSLKRNGEPSGAPVRLGERCRGGIDALSVEKETVLACLRRPAWGEPSQLEAVMLYVLADTLEVKRLFHFGNSGSVSDGIGIAEQRGRIRVVWHDGSPAAHQVWLSEIDTRTRDTPVPRAISNPARLAVAPSVDTGKQGWIVWTESWMEEDRTRSRIVLYDGRGAPRAVIPVGQADAAPRILKIGGRTVLAYRDQPDADRKAGLYLLRMGADGRPAGDSVRVARADARGRPSLSPCFGGAVLATPRTYGSSMFVGVNWIDADLSKPHGEQHFCEVSRELSLSASVCVGSHSILLMAEKGASTQEHTKIHGVTFDCE
jgi:hypothetical protein